MFYRTQVQCCRLWPSCFFYQQFIVIVSVSLWEQSLPHNQALFTAHIPAVLSEEPNSVPPPSRTLQWSCRGEGRGTQGSTFADLGKVSHNRYFFKTSRQTSSLTVTWVKKRGGRRKKTKKMHSSHVHLLSFNRNQIHFPKH